MNDILVLRDYTPSLDLPIQPSLLVGLVDILKILEYLLLIRELSLKDEFKLTVLLLRLYICSVKNSPLHPTHLILNLYHAIIA